MVRAKFKCAKIERTLTMRKGADGVYRDAEQWTVVMNAVYSNDPASENAKFWDASPGGTFSMNCVNPAAVAEFELGKEYYFDISLAPVK
jgi:hypothetical protein